MKTLKFIPLLILLVFGGYNATAQENTEEKLNLPGDNLNLYAVMNLFRESKTLEEFEKNLNAEDSKINNLDLNNDDKIDYVKVIDNVDGDVHTIVLQVSVSEKENQDVAVFTVQKDNKNQVQVQLIGDEELYGKDYIIEPNYDDASSGSTSNPGYAGKTKTTEKETVVVTKTTYVEVASWPVVTYIYVPTYTVWHSPWYWGYYPPYWNPWKPYYWDYYYGYHSHYYSHYYGYYHHSHYNRYPHYNDHYYNGHRSYSNTVNQHRQSGMYKNTYSRPETRNQGSADFKKKYPDGYRPASKPANSSNVNRPTSQPGNSSRPANTNPSTRPANTSTSTRPNVNQPSTRPATATPSSRPNVNQPSRRPASKPATTNPSTRPAPNNSSTRSDVKKSVERSSHNIPTAKPGNQHSTRPSTSSPSNTRSNSKPATTKQSSGSQKSTGNSRTERPK